MTRHETFLRFLRTALWGEHIDLTGKELTMGQYQSLMQLANEQAVAGLFGQVVMDSGIRLPKQAAMEVYSLVEHIRQRNEVMDQALAHLCQDLQRIGVRFVVFKGQTLARHYPCPALRQSGDIDFAVHPEDWKRAIEFFQQEWQAQITDNNSDKHIEFEIEGVQYELHRKLTSFAYPRHQRYWEERVMAEVWEHIEQVEIGGALVPVMAPVYNVLYTFVHIFFHLIIEGIGLRQFCDWSLTIHNSQVTIHKSPLEKHLKGIGLEKAYTGLGALLTDYLGLPEERFPFTITADDHKRAPRLMENIWEMGNFGHNKPQASSRGIRNGLMRLSRTVGQARQFHHYAPAEAWWRIPYIFKWWGTKLGRKVKRLGIKN